MIPCRSGLRLRASHWSAVLCRVFSSSPRWRPLQELPDGNTETIRREAFAPSLPTLLPRGQFSKLPAIRKWFSPSEKNTLRVPLNYTYLDSFGGAIVPLEFTRLKGATSKDEAEDFFQRAEAPLSIFLEWTKLATTHTPERLYLAQASLSNLPKAFVEDLPTPEILHQVGAGDIYDTNVWMGIAPTYTPLHRDPNPNLFVQLAGHKIVRMIPPDAGDRVFSHVKSALGTSGSSTFRGEDMMKGHEKRLLEAEIWGKSSRTNDIEHEGYEAHVWGAEGLFIPKGWWHSIKGVDHGISASVNWWFR